jgi:hypothetical protein
MLIGSFADDALWVRVWRALREDVYLERKAEASWQAERR